MNFLLQLLDRLGPAQKSLSVVGFKNSSAQARTTLLEEFIRSNFASEQGHVHIEHISKGPAHDRTLTGVSVIEFVSRTRRNAVLAGVKTKQLQLKEVDGNQLRVDYAKTKKQLNRNALMHKAFEMIKTDGASNGKTVEKEWKVGTEKGTRHITVNKEVAFLQSKGDLVGLFVGSFAHLAMK